MQQQPTTILSGIGLSTTTLVVLSGLATATLSTAALAQGTPTILMTPDGAVPTMAIGAPAGATPMLAVPITMTPMGTIPPPSMPMIVMVPSVFPSPIANTGPMTFNHYQVKSGGRLGDVARRTGVPVAELRRLNPGISSSQWLAPGTLVALPQS